MKSVRLNSGSVRSAQISCRKAAKLLCYTLLALSLIVYADSKGAPRNCSAPIVGTYRDCLCGLMWRDVETHCQDDFTYYQPILTQENLTCPFQCLNGGVFVNNKRCSCGQKAHGLCCETRKSTLIAELVFLRNSIRMNADRHLLSDLPAYRRLCHSTPHHDTTCEVVGVIRVHPSSFTKCARPYACI